MTGVSTGQRSPSSPVKSTPVLQILQKATGLLKLGKRLQRGAAARNRAGGPRHIRPSPAVLHQHKAAMRGVLHPSKAKIKQQLMQPGLHEQIAPLRHCTTSCSARQAKRTATHFRYSRRRCFCSCRALALFPSPLPRLLSHRNKAQRGLRRRRGRPLSASVSFNDILGRRVW